ncbi:hypothetical protein KJA15_01365 [Patescibacteria group bacterium]|nr:hypothetical protein [Patescibacteria group bacterium]
MLARIKQFVKDHQDDIILLIGVILISLLSFAIGFIVARQKEKEPIIIKETSLLNGPLFQKGVQPPKMKGYASPGTL